jgi:hypothetical protein
LPEVAGRRYAPRFIRLKRWRLSSALDRHGFCYEEINTAPQKHYFLETLTFMFNRNLLACIVPFWNNSVSNKFVIQVSAFVLPFSKQNGEAHFSMWNMIP